jgi:hypothetical protein
MTTTPADSTTVDLIPTPADLGANKVTLIGDRTTITFFPQTPGPIVVGHEGGKLVYEGPEGAFTFFGAEILREESQLGYLLTLVLPSNPDVGRNSVTILLPRAEGVERGAPLVFATVAIKTTGRGFIDRPGPALTYDVLPLVATAEDVILPL